MRFSEAVAILSHISDMNNIYSYEIMTLHNDIIINIIPIIIIISL